MDGFLGIDDYSSAARGPDRAVLLDKSGFFLLPEVWVVTARHWVTGNESVGAALGYQMFLGETDRHLTFELGGRATTSHGRFFEASQPNSFAMPTLYQYVF